MPDLILMDVMMPRMDGAAAVECLGKDPATKDIPVIFLTATITKEEEGNQASGIQVETGEYRFIAKPFDSQKLLDEIEDVLGG